MSIYDVKRTQTVLISFTNNVNKHYKRWTLLELAFVFDNLDVDKIYIYRVNKNNSYVLTRRFVMNPIQIFTLLAANIPISSATLPDMGWSSNNNKIKKILDLENLAVHALLAVYIREKAP